MNEEKLNSFLRIHNLFSLDFIVSRTSRSLCLLCKTNLDKTIGFAKWHIPLCKKHRMGFLNKQTPKQMCNMLFDKQPTRKRISQLNIAEDDSKNRKKLR